MTESATLSPNDILVRAQTTPNPLAMKFIVNSALKNTGKATYRTREDAANNPLVESLFDITGVTQVHLFQNTVTITHLGELLIDELEQQVSSVIKTRMTVHNPDFLLEDESNVKQSGKLVDRPPEILKIEEILDRTVRPSLQADGGDIEVISYEGNEVRILYQGACGGCPSAMSGTLDAIQSILQHELGKPDLQVHPI